MTYTLSLGRANTRRIIEKRRKKLCGYGSCKEYTGKNYYCEKHRKSRQKARKINKIKYKIQKPIYPNIEYKIQ